MVGARVIGGDRAGNASSNGVEDVKPGFASRIGDEYDSAVIGLSSAIVVVASDGGTSGGDISPLNRVAAEDVGDVMGKNLVGRRPMFG